MYQPPKKKRLTFQQEKAVANQRPNVLGFQYTNPKHLGLAIAGLGVAYAYRRIPSGGINAGEGGLGYYWRGAQRWLHNQPKQIAKNVFYGIDQTGKSAIQFTDDAAHKAAVSGSRFLGRFAEGAVRVVGKAISFKTEQALDSYIVGRFGGYDNLARAIEKGGHFWIEDNIAPGGPMRAALMLYNSNQRGRTVNRMAANALRSELIRSYKLGNTGVESAFMRTPPRFYDMDTEAGSALRRMPQAQDASLNLSHLMTMLTSPVMPTANGKKVWSIGANDRRAQQLRDILSSRLNDPAVSKAFREHLAKLNRTDTDKYAQVVDYFESNSHIYPNITARVRKSLGEGWFTGEFAPDHAFTASSDPIVRKTISLVDEVHPLDNTVSSSPVALIRRPGNFNIPYVVRSKTRSY